MADGTTRSVAEAVADGEAVDWSSARRRVSPDSAPLVDALEQLARVGRVGSAARRAAYLPERLLPAGVRLLLTLAVIQILAGGVGSFSRLVIQPGAQDLARAAALLAFSVAAYVLLSRGTDRRAAWLGAFFLFVAAGFALPGVWHLARTAGISPRESALARGLVVESFLPATLWQFTRVFPLTVRLTRIDRLATGAARICWIAGAVLMAGNHLIAIGWLDPAPAIWLDRINYRAGAGFWTTVMLLILPALPVILIRTREAPPLERWRVGLFLAGLAGGILPVLVEVVLEQASPAFSYWVNKQPGVFPFVATAMYGSLLSIPFVTSYAVIVQRVIEVRTILRAGARYLIAKSTLTILTAVPLAILVVYLFQHRSESLASLFSGAGLPLTTLAAAGAAGLVLRVRIERRLDRWFSRHAEDSALILARSTERLRYSRTPRELAEAIADAVGRVLHADARLLLLDTRTDAFRHVGAGGRPLPRDSALIALADVQPAVDVSAEGETYRLLPGDEREWIGAQDAVMVVPVRQSAEDSRISGLILCGARGDALRFSADDGRFLAALAGAASMALDNVELRARQDQRPLELAVHCPACRVVRDDRRPGESCDCGTALEGAALAATVLDKYRVDHLIGAGGMGIVYRATDLLLGRDVAIKTLPRLGDDDVARLRAEARTMASLDHPGLAKIHAIEMWRGTPLLVVEYLAGGSLAQRLRSGPMPARESLDVGLAMLDALAYMHGRGVLHRDLKPANVGFTLHGQPRLLDFGLATLFGGNGAGFRPDAAPAGTPLYMPPEALEGILPDQLFDLWGFSVSLFEMVTGKHPFRDGQQAKTCVAEPLRTFFESALAPEREHRFGSAEAISGELTMIRDNFFSAAQED